MKFVTKLLNTFKTPIAHNDSIEQKCSSTSGISPEVHLILLNTFVSQRPDKLLELRSERVPGGMKNGEKLLWQYVQIR